MLVGCSQAGCLALDPFVSFESITPPASCLCTIFKEERKRERERERARERAWALLLLHPKVECTIVECKIK